MQKLFNFQFCCEVPNLVGMQLPEKYKEKFDISSEGVLSARKPSLETSNFSLYFSGSFISFHFISFY
jgi:hypothetical protein